MKLRRALLALLAVFALVGAACAEDNPGPADGGSPTSPADVPQFTTIEEGVLKVGSCLDYPPFESVVDGDETGFDVDLVEEVASRLDLQVEWITANFDTIFTAVAGGNQFDMVAAAVTATGDTGEERDEVVDFSDLYYNSRQAFTVNTDETPDLTSYEDLEPGDVVGVQRGTTGEVFAEENLPEGVEIKSFQNAPPAFTDLEAGQITGVIVDEPVSAEIVKDRPSLALVQPIDADEKYAFAFSPDNPELRDAFNAALREVIEDGTYEEIFHEYFPDVDVPEEYRAA